MDHIGFGINLSIFKTGPSGEKIIIQAHQQWGISRANARDLDIAFG